MSESKSTQQPIYKKWWFWVIIVAVIIGIGAVVGNSNNGPTKIGENESSQGTSSNTNSKTFKTGDVIAVDGLEVSVTSVQRNWTGELSKPKDGREYVKVNIQIDNKEKDKADYNTLNWKMEDSTGALESTAFVLGNDDSLDSGQLMKGGSKKGSIVFDVPKDDTALKLHYLPNIFTDANEVIIEL